MVQGGSLGGKDALCHCMHAVNNGRQLLALANPQAYCAVAAEVACSTPTFLVRLEW